MKNKIINLYKKLNPALKSIFYFLFPSKCYLCENISKEHNLCAECKNFYKSLFITGHISDFNFNLRVLYASIYASKAKKMILDFKYRKQKNIIDIYLNLLENDFKFLKYIKKQKYITYIPTSKKNIEIRSYDQAELIAKKMAQKYNLRFIKLLTKNEYINKENKTKILEQKKLSREERLHNVKGNFKVIDKEMDIKGNLLVVDDLYTTGATAYEVSRILKETNKDINIYFFTLGYTKY